MRTVVIEMTDDVYRTLAQEAELAGMTLAEILLNHTFAQMLNALADEGQAVRWLRVYKLWRKYDMRHAPPLDLEAFFDEVGHSPTQ